MSSSDNPSKVGNPLSEGEADAGVRQKSLVSRTFLVLGVWAAIAYVLLPMARSLLSSHWVACPCLVLQCEAVDSFGLTGPATSIGILYEYEYRGVDYVGREYDFGGRSAGNREQVLKIVKRLGTVQAATCFVNPDDPAESVMDRGFPRDAWGEFIPVLLLLASIPGLTGVGRSMEPAFSVPSKLPVLNRSGWAALKPHRPPLLEVAGAVFCVAIFEGFMALRIHDLRRDNPVQHTGIVVCWCLSVLGSAVIATAESRLIGRFRRHPRVSINSDCVVLSQPALLRWRLRRPQPRFARIEILLEGSEHCRILNRSRLSHDMQYASRVFISSTLAILIAPSDLTQGEIEFVIPAGNAPSFARAHNKILYTVIVRGYRSDGSDNESRYALWVAAHSSQPEPLRASGAVTPMGV